MALSSDCEKQSYDFELLSARIQANTRENLLILLLQQGESDASELSKKLMISVQAIRRHLRSLKDEGLVECSCTAIGPGRPCKLWKLTSLGRQRFPDSSGRFALELLESIWTNLPEDKVEQLLNQQAEKKAQKYRDQLKDAPLGEGLEQLAELRRQDGYVTICGPEEDGNSWRLQELHCSLQGIAKEFPTVCHQELMLIRSAIPDCLVERVHWLLEGGHTCGFRITPMAS